MAKCDEYPTGAAALRAYLHDPDGPVRLSRAAIVRALQEHDAAVEAVRAFMDAIHFSQDKAAFMAAVREADKLARPVLYAAAKGQAHH